ncbi:formin-like protein 13 [Trifolium pratense]|uniref:formin-like protein 13 n=1 Tax=Trifolium pratense TaxID=57577 RepID=UPI001E69071F|nr:formin-like protein 13 [Trifolium pratense]
MLRKLFFRKPPDGLLEICERVYVFDCCFTTEAWNEDKYKVYMDGIVASLRENVPDASLMVFNFREEETKSLMANVMSEYDITIMDYPRHYEGCPVLKMELIHHFLRSSESWLSLGQHNVLLMHCERGAWPVLAFMLAALLIYRKVYTGEHRTLDMVYRQSPHELLHLLTPLNPLPSQSRYLQYISRRNVAVDWPPLDRALMLDCIILRFFPNFDGKGGCHPLFRIYGQDPFSADKNPKMLYSMPKKSKNVRAYKQGECQLIKIDINCHIQGDVVIEGINLNDDMEHEMMMFRVMFNTAFVRSNILMLNRDEIDVLWDAKDHFPKDFRAEILFSEMDAAAAIIENRTSCFEEKEGLPIEAFAKVQEIFSHVDWMDPKADAALNVLQHINTSGIMNDKLDNVSDQHVETGTSLYEIVPKTPQRNSNEVIQCLSSGKSSPNNDISGKEDKKNKLAAIPQQANTSDSICQETFCSSERTMESGKCPTGSTYLDIKPEASKLTSSCSLDSSLSPGTPPLRPPSTTSAKKVHDSPLHTESPPHHIFPLKSEHQPQDSSYSPISSPTTGTHPSLLAVSSIQPPPPLSSKTPLNDIPPVKTRLESPPSQPSTPPPPTPPLKDQKAVRAGPSSPPPPPPPPLPSSPPLKVEQPSRFKPPPPPPPPQLSLGAASPTIAPPAPPAPPPPATLSSGNPNASMQKSPPVPPPPIPLGKEGLKPGSAFPMSLKVPGIGGPQSKGRGLPIGSKNNSKKLKPLHWMKLSRAVQGSLWDETQKSGEASKAPEIDISELENLFSAAAPSSGLAKKSNVQSSAKPKSEKVQLIDHRRAYNCEIMLSQVKVPLHDLMTSVLTLEESALDTDQVENLIKFCPTKEEMELIKSYDGETEKLGRCEQFFVELMKVPRVESKLRVFSFKIQFHSQVSDLKNSLNAVNSSAEEIRNSVKLKRIMQTILTLGNALNQGTARGSAIGFRLETLLKLTETRARNNKMTLMHYLCKVLDDKLPEVLDFSKDLANLEPAAKIQLKFLAEEMQAINKGLEKVVQELSTSENDGPISETFRKKLKEFLCSAEAEVRSLASLYSAVGRNVDALILYFGEDPSRCPFEQVVTTLLNFTGMFNKAHEENCKQQELEMKKTADSEKKKCESERILPTAIHTGNVN